MKSQSTLVQILYCSHVADETEGDENCQAEEKEEAQVVPLSCSAFESISTHGGKIRLIIPIAIGSD